LLLFRVIETEIIFLPLPLLLLPLLLSLAFQDIAPRAFGFYIYGR
jgi:hypothetical protein